MALSGIVSFAQCTTLRYGKIKIANNGGSRMPTPATHMATEEEMMMRAHSTLPYLPVVAIVIHAAAVRSLDTFSAAQDVSVTAPTAGSQCLVGTLARGVSVAARGGTRAHFAVVLHAA